MSLWKGTHTYVHDNMLLAWPFVVALIRQLKTQQQHSWTAVSRDSKEKQENRTATGFCYVVHMYICMGIFILCPTHAFPLFFLCALLAFSQQRQTTTWSVSLSNHTQTHTHTPMQAVGRRGGGRCSRLSLRVSDSWLSVAAYTRKN